MNNLTITIVHKTRYEIKYDIMKTIFLNKLYVVT